MKICFVFQVNMRSELIESLLRFLHVCKPVLEFFLQLEVTGNSLKTTLRYEFLLFWYRKYLHVT